MKPVVDNSASNPPNVPKRFAPATFSQPILEAGWVFPRPILNPHGYY